MKFIFPLLVFASVGLANPPAAGKVLILDNEQTLEGDIERVGDDYRVSSGIGSAFIPAARVLKLCASKDDALAFLRQNARREDPDEHLRLARWCHVNGLTTEAIVELKKALVMRPNHAESNRLLQYLEQWSKQPVKTVTKTTPPVAKKQSDVSLAVSAEAMGQFTSRVQPILMNACAKCHASNENGSAFRLERTKGIGTGNRRAVQENITAVLGQVLTKSPERSPLLVKAISPHGDASEAPIKGRKETAYRLLEDWVRSTLDSNPHLQDVLRPSLPVVQTLASSPEPKVTRPAPVPSKPMETPAVKPDAFAEESTSMSKPTKEPSPPESQVEEEPESEFDAAIFNRRLHPKGKTPSRPTPPVKDPE